FPLRSCRARFASIHAVLSRRARISQGFGDGSDGWSFLSRDAFKIMLGECTGEKPASELGDHSYVAYLIVEGVDQFYTEVAERGAEVLSQPATEPWGLREFSIRTPDGHRVRFGEPTGVAG